MNRILRRQTVPGALILAAALLATACIPDIQRPEVRLAGVRLGGLGLEGGLLYVDLGVVNPNSFDLAADGLTYDVDLSDPGVAEDEWVDVAAGTFEEDFGVGGNDSTVVAIPVEFTYDGLGAIFESVLETGTFQYRVSGIVALDEPIRTDIPYEREGTVSVLDDQ